MAEVGYASLGIIPSFDGFQSKLESGMAPGLLAAGRSGGSKFGGVAGSTAGKRFGSVFSSAAKASLVGLAGAGALAVAFGKSAIDEARDARKVGALTASTIKATGKAANVSARQVANLAEKISEKTGIDDEQIQTGQNMLLTFKNIRNEVGKGDKVFDQSTRILVDLSSAMGTDAKSSAIQLGKALNDPVKGITALTRVGVTFSDQQKKQIEQMVEAGDVAGAQKVILSELKSEFGGAAAAQADEADKLSVAWGNFKEEIGAELLPALDDVAIFLRKKGIPAVRDFSDWFTDEGVPAIKDFYDEAKPVAEEVLPAIADALGTAKDTAKKLAPIVEGVFDGFNKLPDWVQSVIVLGAGAAALKSKLGGGKSGLAGGLLGGLSSLKPIPVFVTNQGVGGLPGAGTKGAPVVPGAAVSGPKVGIGFLAGLSLLGAASQPDTINPEDQFGAFYESADAARKAFKDMRDSGQYTAEQLEAKYEFFRKMFGEDFDYMSYHARQTMQKIQDATPRYLQTELVVNGVDEARSMVELALEPFMVGRTAAKESQGSDAMLPAPSDVPSRGRRSSSRRSGGVTVNQHIGTVNDSKQLNKDAAAKAQQAAMGGFG